MLSLEDLPYKVNERALCYHGPLIYEAKILQTTIFNEVDAITKQDGPHYLVHYKGWKPKWDEWVPSSRLLKLNEENLQLQKELRENTPRTGNTSAFAFRGLGRGAASASGREVPTASTGPRSYHKKEYIRGTKRGREEDEGGKKMDMKLDVPEVLRLKLIDDWESVTKNKQLVTLPREPTVEEILKNFQDYVTENKNDLPHLHEPALVVPIIVSGLQCYFDRSLGANLLYEFERVQYADMRKLYITGPKVIIGQEKEMSAVYGAEHLLRMLVNLPQMIAASSLDSESVGLVRDYVNELLVYMVKERDRIFQPEYQDSTVQYQHVSKS